VNKVRSFEVNIPLLASLGGFRQVGLVVSNFDATMSYMTNRLGIGPFFVIRRTEIPDFFYRGQPSGSPVLSVGFAQAGDIQVELIQQHNDVPSGYLDFLGSGRGGCQHLAVWLDSPDAYWTARSHLIDGGLTLVHESTSKERGRFAFFTCEELGTCMVEIAEGLTAKAKPIIDMVAKASVNWNGRDPVRELR
jgi:hypothetical protein